jgi:hypothetical protein
MEEIGEIEQRILSELEEAWENDVCSILNTVYDPPSSARLTEFCNAARSLYERGLVRVTKYKFGPDGYTSRELPESEERALLRSLEDQFGDLDEEGYWAYREPYSANVIRPQLLVTEVGHDLAFRLLDERGYQWWKRRS